MSRAAYLLEAGHRRRLEKLGSTAKAKVAQIIADLNPCQREFVLDTHRRICAKTGRRAGKTRAVLTRALRICLLRQKADYAYIALSRPSAKRILWRDLKDLNAEYELGLVFSETELTATFPKTNSRIMLFGADDRHEIEKLRGQFFAEVAIDETASFPADLLQELLEEVLKPTLADLRGSLIMVGTPKHILSGLFYDATRNGSTISRPWAERDDWVGKPFAWSFHTWHVKDNLAMPQIWEEFQNTKLENGWSDSNPIWMREYLGIWQADDTDRVYKYRPYTDDGLPWNVWIPGPKAKGNPYGLPGDHHWHYVVGLDLGFVDKFACEVIAYSDTHPNLFQVFEFAAAGYGYHKVAELLKSIIATIGYYPDSIVADKAGSGGMILLSLAEEHGLTVEGAEKAQKLDHIELVNSDLVDGHIKILENSKLATEWLELQWDVLGQKENKAQANHCADAFVYARRKSLHHFSHAPPEKPSRADAAERDRVAAENRTIEREAAMRRGDWDRDMATDQDADEAFWTGQDDGDLWR